MKHECDKSLAIDMMISDIQEMKKDIKTLLQNSGKDEGEKESKSKTWSWILSVVAIIVAFLKG